MNGEISVRAAVVADADAVHGAERKYIDCPWTREQVVGEIQNADALFFVAECDGVFAGYLSGLCAADECEISNVAVCEKFRRRGIATALFAEFIDAAKRRGIRSLFLLVRTDNAAAIALYTGLGFEKVGQRRNYYNGADAFVMKSNI